MKRTSKFILKSILIVFSAIVIGFGVGVYFLVYSPNLRPEADSSFSVYIPTGTDREQFKSILKPYLKNPSTLNTWMKIRYRNWKISSGKFTLEKNWSNDRILKQFFGGREDEVNFTFNNIDSVEEFAGIASRMIEADSSSIVSAFEDEAFLSREGIDPQMPQVVLLPNTYRLYWDTTARDLIRRLKKEYDAFWAAGRTEKARALGLTPLQVITLASIVQKETARKEEAPLVAGLYLNRLKKGWRMQSDPTVIFALKKIHGDDLEIKRVLTKDLQVESPYNTYRIDGLPPGPITIPDVVFIDAVLNPSQHSYMYMCASVDRPGYHEFASSASQHEQNRRKYTRWLDSIGTFR